MSEPMFHIAKEFSDDLRRLHPLSKLKGINENEYSRSKLSNLKDTTEDYSDDLVMAIDELLNPSIDIQQCDSWQFSRLRICAATEIILRLHELGQPDLVAVSLNSL